LHCALDVVALHDVNRSREDAFTLEILCLRQRASVFAAQPTGAASDNGHLVREIEKLFEQAVAGVVWVCDRQNADKIARFGVRRAGRDRLPPSQLHPEQ
jgi:hypothetical protein